MALTTQPVLDLAWMNSISPNALPMHRINVGYFPLADMVSSVNDVRFRGKSGHKHWRPTRCHAPHEASCLRCPPVGEPTLLKRKDRLAAVYLFRAVDSRMSAYGP